MAQVIGKWILDETITPPKMDSTATFTFEKIIVGDATVTGNFHADGRSSFDGPIDGDIAVIGDFYAGGSARVVGDFIVNGDSTGIGSSSIGGNLIVNSDFAAIGSSYVGGSARVAGDFIVNGDSTGIGNSSIEGSLIINGDFASIGSSYVGGSSRVAGDFIVNGDSTGIGNSSIEGSLIINSDFATLGNSYVGGSARVVGSSIVDVDSTVGNDLIVLGTAYLNNNGDIFVEAVDATSSRLVTGYTYLTLRDSAEIFNVRNGGSGNYVSANISTGALSTDLDLLVDGKATVTGAINLNVAEDILLEAVDATTSIFITGYSYLTMKDGSEFFNVRNYGGKYLKADIGSDTVSTNMKLSSNTIVPNGSSGVTIDGDATVTGGFYAKDASATSFYGKIDPNTDAHVPATSFFIKTYEERQYDDVPLWFSTVDTFPGQVVSVRYVVIGKLCTMSILHNDGGGYTNGMIRVVNPSRTGTTNYGYIFIILSDSRFSKLYQPATVGADIRYPLYVTIDDATPGYPISYLCDAIMPTNNVTYGSPIIYGKAISIGYTQVVEQYAVPSPYIHYVDERVSSTRPYISQFPFTSRAPSDSYLYFKPMTFTWITE
jgi:cytoskeletal protein CcmA (bactofilin family)